jgi:hypothetical protein
MCLFLSHANGGTRSSDLLQALPRALRIYVTPHHRTTRSLVSEKTSYRKVGLREAAPEAKKKPGLIVAPALVVVEAAGVEPASANALSVRFYEHSSRFNFALLCGPGRRKEASPVGFP